MAIYFAGLAIVHEGEQHRTFGAESDPVDLTVNRKRWFEFAWRLPKPHVATQGETLQSFLVQLYRSGGAPVQFADQPALKGR